MPNTYIITGATSFIGSWLTRQLLSNGHQVVAVCRNKEKAETMLGRRANLRVTEATLDHYDQMSETISSADIFIHLAWEGTSHQGRNISDVQQANIRHSVEAMHVAAKLGCRLFVMAGSQAEYGTCLERITEETPCHPFSEYGKAKLEVCRQGFPLAEQLGMKYLHLRIFSLYGEGDHPWTMVMSSIDHMLKNEPVPLSACTQQWNFLYVGDAAQQISLLCQYALQTDSFRHEIFNIASDDTRQLRRFVEAIYQEAHSSSELQFGAVPQQNIVSLNPDTSKLRNAIHFVSSADFNNTIQSIIHSIIH